MRPVVCFYHEDQFIYSDKYVLQFCPEDMSVSDFLDSVEKNFRTDLKIIQVNFEYDRPELFQHQKALYPIAKASVFVLTHFELLPLNQMMAKVPASFNPIQHDFSVLEKQEAFIEKVQRVRAAIAAGRLYQLNLTAALQSPTTHSGEKIFKNYFEKFSGHYKAFLPLAETDVISFSPELFLRRQGNKLRTLPIKGSSAVDTKSTQELLASEKEAAELSMIVDLLRNDLNRLNPNAGAVVKQHRAQMSLGYIQHTYSEIEIESDRGLTETLQATAPGGSISGCPKTESLIMISELESYRRQAYTGCHGWWKDNNFSIALTIRSFYKNQDQLFYHAGCGLVYDSVPEKEWNEFVMKTAHLLKS